MEKLQKEKCLAGLKQVKKTILCGEAKAVYVAKDCDPYMAGEIELLCAERGLEIVYAESMRELGRACRVDVPTAAAVIVK